MKNESLLKHLMTLQREGTINSSSLSASVYKELEHFGISRGFLVVEKAGRGKCLKVVNTRILEIEINRLSPDVDSLNDLSNRLKNLAVNKDTKTGETSLNFTYCICKAVGEGVVVNGCDVSAITKSLGCFSLPVCDDAKDIECNGSLLLVENQLMIDDLKWIPVDFKGVVLYYAGNLSDRVLNWLKKSSFASVSIFPDYDAVGINNFANLKAVLPDAEWYWIPDWNNVLEKFGNKDLWAKENQQALFENLWSKFMENGFPEQQIKTLMEEIRKQGKMLEQESALL